jgi:hypothetical protein
LITRNSQRIKQLATGQTNPRLVKTAVTSQTSRNWSNLTTTCQNGVGAHFAAINVAVAAAGAVVAAAAAVTAVLLLRTAQCNNCGSDATAAAGDPTSASITN